jgi:dihydrodipicolinate synthase/N-acetylneuraminate lyase
MSAGRERARRPLQGVIPVVAIPLDERGNIDLDSLRGLVERLVGAGVHGVAALGVAGEIWGLTDDERRAVARAVVDQAGGRVPVVVGASHQSAEAAAVLAREAADAGADVLMVMPPYFIKPSAEGLEQYYGLVARSAGVPVMIQDNPGWTGVSIPVDLMGRLAAIPEVRYAKVEVPSPPAKIAQVAERMGDRLAVLGGLGGNWLPEELARGARGTMPAAIMPQVYVRVWDLWQAGRQAAARRVFHRYHPLIRLTGLPSVGLAMAKYVLWRAGWIATPRARHPLPALGPQDRADVDQVLEELEILEVMRGRRSPD